MKNEQPKMNIVIAGAGFGGVRVARKLAASGRFNITVIANRDTFRFYPALFATATGHSYSESIIPLTEMLEHLPGVTFIQDELTTLDAKRKRIQGESGAWYRYDSLVLALGVVTNYFGIEGLKEFSFGIKSEREISDFKRHLHTGIDDDEKASTSYVVIGAGPTGVELGAALKGYVAHVAKCHNAPTSGIHFKIIEAMDRVLPKMSAHASRMVEKRLRRLNIEVMLNSKVEGQTVDELKVNGEEIKTHTVIWTSGVANSPFFQANASQFKLAPNGKVQVDSFLQGAPSIYVIGDNAATPYSGLAQTALHDASYVARNLKRQVRRQPPKKYRVYRPPLVVPVGPRWAIFEWGWLTFASWPGAILRRLADLMGYIDLLPLGKAIRLWLRASHLEEECPICRRDIEKPSKQAPPAEAQ